MVDPEVVADAAEGIAKLLSPANLRSAALAVVVVFMAGGSYELTRSQVASARDDISKLQGSANQTQLTLTDLANRVNEIDRSRTEITGDFGRRIGYLEAAHDTFQHEDSTRQQQLTQTLTALTVEMQQVQSELARLREAVDRQRHAEADGFGGSNHH